MDGWMKGWFARELARVGFYLDFGGRFDCGMKKLNYGFDSWWADGFTTGGVGVIGGLGRGEIWMWDWESD